MPFQVFFLFLFFLPIIFGFEMVSKIRLKGFFDLIVWAKTFNKLPFFILTTGLWTTQPSVSLNTLCLSSWTKLHMWIVMAHQRFLSLYIKVSKIWGCKKNCLCFHKWWGNNPFEINFFTSSWSTINGTIVILQQWYWRFGYWNYFSWTQ